MRTGSTIVLTQNQAVRRVYPAPVGAPAVPDKPFEPGTRVDRYLVLDRLGGGGSGTVYLARDTELDREVALKVLSHPQCQQPLALTRFRAEAQAQARLRSPHVITLYSLLELPIAAILVLEYVDGETLEARLRRDGPLAPEAAVAVFEQALLGLEHVHEMGVIHRDLKPSNLFLTKAGQVKIMDFSVAKLNAQDAYPPRTMVGTLLYIAPEQISGRSTDVRSDIYALGVSLYESVTGRLPFERKTDYALMHAHVQERPPQPRDFAPALSPALERVILKAVEKEPAQRYRSAPEFRAALLKAASPLMRSQSASLPANAYGPVPPSGGARRSARRIFAGIALDLLLVAAVGGMLYALTLYPAKNQTVEPALATTAPMKPVSDTDSAAAAAPAAKPVRVRTNPVPRPRAVPPAPNRAPTTKDRYKSLRQAWGD